MMLTKLLAALPGSSAMWSCSLAISSSSFTFLSTHSSKAWAWVPIKPLVLIFFSMFSLVLSRSSTNLSLVSKSSLILEPQSAFTFPVLLNWNASRKLLCSFHICLSSKWACSSRLSFVESILCNCFTSLCSPSANFGESKYLAIFFFNFSFCLNFSMSCSGSTELPFLKLFCSLIISASRTCKSSSFFVFASWIICSFSTVGISSASSQSRPNGIPIVLIAAFNSSIWYSSFIFRWFLEMYWSGTFTLFPSISNSSWVFSPASSAPSVISSTVPVGRSSVPSLGWLANFKAFSSLSFFL